ncbi:MAG: hypothetical protein LYZ66_00730 [Nitrososphaerales archaeon]|nr:hypothetical protein [Nitrososphaerales archaeon]
MVDITSQELTFSITATSSGPMARVDVYIDNVSVGAVQGPFESGVPKQVGLGVPTTITVSVKQSYRVLVGGVYTDSAGKTAAEYWQAFDVVAAGG